MIILSLSRGTIYQLRYRSDTNTIREPRELERQEPPVITQISVVSFQTTTQRIGPPPMNIASAIENSVSNNVDNSFDADNWRQDLPLDEDWITAIFAPGLASIYVHVHSRSDKCIAMFRNAIELRCIVVFRVGAMLSVCLTIMEIVFEAWGDLAGVMQAARSQLTPESCRGVISLIRHVEVV